MGEAIKKEITIGGVWARRIGERVEVLLDLDGNMVKVIDEPFEANFSTIVEPGGIIAAMQRRPRLFGR